MKNRVIYTESPITVCTVLQFIPHEQILKGNRGFNDCNIASSINPKERIIWKSS
jgi:hypothetical protein